MPTMRTLLTILSLSLGLGALPAGGPAWAQSTSGSPHDLSFEVINATTGGPGRIERLQLEYSFGILQPVLDVEPSGSSFILPEVPIKERGRYVLTAWAHGVPYYWSLKGRELLDGPVRLPVFDLIEGLDDVAIAGLDLIMRKTESLLEAEYMLQVENRARPQATVLGGAALELAVPAGAESATLSYGQGPEPQTLTLAVSGGRTRLEVPLTSGRNPMRLQVRVPFTEGLEMPVGANVPIEGWSLMATPATLDIRGFGLESTGAAGGGSHLRFRGPPLAAGEDHRFRIHTLDQAVGAEEDLFTKEASPATEEESSPDETTEEDNGFPFVVLTPIFVVILALVARKRRR